MTVKERIECLESIDELTVYPDRSSPETLSAADLKALADSHTKLLEAIPGVVAEVGRKLAGQQIGPQMKKLLELVEEAEKLG